MRPVGVYSVGFLDWGFVVTTPDIRLATYKVVLTHSEMTLIIRMMEQQVSATEGTSLEKEDLSLLWKLYYAEVIE